MDPPRGVDFSRFEIPMSLLPRLATGGCDIYVPRHWVGCQPTLGCRCSPPAAIRPRTNASGRLFSTLCPKCVPGSILFAQAVGAECGECFHLFVSKKALLNDRYTKSYSFQHFVNCLRLSGDLLRTPGSSNGHFVGVLFRRTAAGTQLGAQQRGANSPSFRPLRGLG